MYHRKKERNNSNVFVLILPILLVFLYTGTTSKTIAAEESGLASREAESQVLHGKVSQNELIDNLEHLGIQCIIREGLAKSLVVDKVHLGSSAYFGNILQGDVIKNVDKLDNNTFLLSLQRAGELYRIKLGLVSAKIPGSVTVRAVNKINQGVVLDSPIKKLDKEAIKKLLPYHIDLIIDISGSMRNPDGTGLLSKLQWCCAEVQDLSERLEPYHKTLDVTLFNTTYNTYEECNPIDVEKFFATNPGGGTNLVAPLTDRLYNALAQYKKYSTPTLIVIITDGLPNVPRDPSVVNQALIDFSKQLTGPDQVLVSFLQIGDNFDGRDFCMDLDTNLVKEGAKYDFVNTKPFFKLKQEGLTGALVDIIAELHDKYTSTNITKEERHFQHFIKNLAPSSQAINNTDATAKEQNSQRQEIEKLILGQ